MLSTVLGFLSLQNNSTDHWIKAITSIVNHYSQSVHIYDLTSDGVISNVLIPSFGIPVVLNASYTDHQNPAKLCLVLCKSVSAVVSFLQDERITLARRMPWVVAFLDESNETLDEMFEMFFNQGILDVVSVHPDDSVINITSYCPFTPEACNSFKPVPMVQFDPGEFNRSVNLFPKDKLKNLHNCPLKVLLFPTWMFISYPAPNTPIFNPRMGELVHIITARIMKFHPEYYYALNTSEGLNLLQRNPKLMAFGAPSGGGTIDRASPMLFGCVTWCLPTKFSDHSIDMLTKCFSWDMWTVFAITLLGVMAVFAFFFERSKEPSDSWILIASAVLQIPMPMYYGEHKNRFFVISLYMGCLVINTMFKARLHSLITTPPGPSRMVDEVEVYKSQLNLYFQLSDRDFVDDILENGLVSPHRIRIYEHSKPDSFNAIMSALQDGSGGLLSITQFCEALAADLGKKRGVYYKVFPMPSCITRRPYNVLGFSKDSPFRTRIFEMTAMIREYGFADRYFTSHLHKEIRPNIPLAISITDVIIFIYFWISALLVCTVVFVLELFVHYNANTAAECLIVKCSYRRN